MSTPAIMALEAEQRRLVAAVHAARSDIDALQARMEDAKTRFNDRKEKLRDIEAAITALSYRE